MKRQSRSSTIRKWTLLGVLFGAGLISTKLQADWSLNLMAGPASVGNGGSNPLGIPPGPADLGVLVTYGDRMDKEVVVSLSPGIFWGKRRYFWDGVYISLGAGLVVGSNALGTAGVMSALGYEKRTGSFLFGADYRKALGIGGAGFVGPYAIRLVGGFVF